MFTNNVKKHKKQDIFIVIMTQKPFLVRLAAK